MASELWQFVVVLGVFAVAALLWLFVIYLPARTLEHSERRRLLSAGENREPDSG